MFTGNGKNEVKRGTLERVKKKLKGSRYIHGEKADEAGGLRYIAKNFKKEKGTSVEMGKIRRRLND
jgi:hypothetical protein